MDCMYDWFHCLLLSIGYLHWRGPSLLSRVCPPLAAISNVSIEISLLNEVFKLYPKDSTLIGPVSFGFVVSTMLGLVPSAWNALHRLRSFQIWFILYLL